VAGAGVCVCVDLVPVFVIRWPGSQTLDPRALVRVAWAAGRVAWAAGPGPRAWRRK